MAGCKLFHPNERNRTFSDLRYPFIVYHTKVFSIPASYHAGVHIPGSFQHAFSLMFTPLFWCWTLHWWQHRSTKAGYGFLPVQRIVWINCATTQTDLISMEKKTLLFKEQHLYYTGAADGFEPLTKRITTSRSTRLNYRRMVEDLGIEPRPSDPESEALPLCKGSIWKW